jgi:filamentous hemagglutinin family protein
MTIVQRARRAAGLAALFAAACGAQAQVRTDGSLGRAAQSLPGPNFVIPENLGALRGANLFHSFSVFGIGTGESATFTTTTRGIANVVSRVTGGEASAINGLLRLAAADGTPGFFFINPAGVTFGAGASIDVPGAFHVSTADYLRFADGRFYADASAASSLSSAPPEAFGFFGTHRATIELGGGARLNAALLQPFSITAGDIALDNARASTTGGDIRIVALGATRAEVPLSGALPVASGELSIVNGATIAAPAGVAVNAGHLSVSAGDIFIDRGGGAITGIVSQANTGTRGNAGTIDVQASGSLQLLNGGVISSSTFSVGDAGSVTVNAASVTIDGSGASGVTGIFSQADRGTSGRAGTVNVVATGQVDIVDGGLISSSTFGTGDAGEVRVSGGTIALDGRGTGRATGVVSNASDGSGNAGAVFVTTPGTLSIVDGATISSGTFTSGDAGAVHVRARDVLMDGGGYEDVVTSIASNARIGSSGRAGNIDVVATGLLSVVAGAEISSSAFASGDAGKVSISADRIFLDARGLSFPGTGIYSVAVDESSGNAGSIDIEVRDLTVRNGAEIATSTFGQGDAGRVSVRASDIRIDGAEWGNAAISSSAELNASGNAGSVDIVASGDVTLRAGGTVASNTSWDGQAGSVHVTARNLTIDGRGSEGATGIMSQTYGDATGNAGNVGIAVADALDIRANGFISSSTFSAGNGGSVDVHAGRITIDGTGGGPTVTGITSGAQPSSTGNAGAVSVTTPGSLTILDSGEISSSTFSSGNAGPVTVRAGSMTVDARSNFAGVFSEAYQDSTGNAGPIDVTVAGLLSLKDQAKITSTTFGAGDAGTVRVTAGELSIDGGGLDFSYTGIGSNADRPGSGNAGHVAVSVAGAITVAAGGEIASSTFTSGNSGSVSVSAGSMLIDGQGQCPPCTGIFSQSEEGSTGHAGEIDVSVARDLTLRELGLITTGTRNDHDAGRITVRTGSLLVDGGFSGGLEITGIVSNAIEGAGNGGLVEVGAQSVTLRNGGVIGSNTYSAGSGGTVRVTANDVYLDGRDTFIASNTFRGSTGNGGTVDVRATGGMEVLNGAAISTASSGEGSAGSIVVRARDIWIDGGDFERLTGIRSEALGFESPGNAGSIDVVATGDITLGGGGVISSDSQSYGAAGSIRVQAANIDIRGFEFQGSGIVSRAGFFSAAAGTIDVSVAGNLRVANGGRISSATDSIYGPAGSVTVTATDVLVDGINEIGWWSTIDARAGFSSTGQTGNVSVTGRRSVVVVNGGELSTTNDSLYGSPGARPTLLTVSAPLVQLADGGTITAASTGVMPASNLEIRVGERLDLNHASITTSAVEGNGGSITVTGPGVVVLRDSQITTSVTGLAGNGGDITIATRGLVMDTGFVQANTAADNAAGGNVNINVAFLIPSGNTLFVGGAQPIDFRTGVFGLNVIQAAAPTGVSGAISITTPSLDVSAGLTALSARVLDDTGLGRSLCETSGGSALAQAGRGAMPPSARGFLRDEDPDFAAVAAAGQWVPLTTRITCAR